MEGNKRHACGFLRFFKRDGSEGSLHPLEANAEYTIGSDSQATIRLKTSKSTFRPIQCVVKVDANGFAKLINKDIAHAVKLNNKAVYSSKYLLPNDVFFVLDKKIRYENRAINKNNLTKLSSRNKVNTPLKSTLTTKGRKSYTDMARKLSPNVLDGQAEESVVGFRSLRGSKTPHLQKRLECFSTLSEKKPVNTQAFNLKTPVPEIKIHEVQSPRSVQSKRTPSRRCSTNKNLVSFCTTSSSGSEETHTGFHVSPFATKLDDLNTPPNNKSIVEINLTPIPSVKKRKSQKFAVTDDSELEDGKTPKTTSHFRNSLHLFSGRKSRKSSLSNALSSISETAKEFGPDSELAAPKRASSTLHSVITPRNATPKLNETYSEEERKSETKLNETYSDLFSGNEQEASVEKSRVKLNETYSEDSTVENDDLRQKQTPNARKSIAELNETFTEEEKVQVQRPVARKSLRKLNKTFSDADFSSVREQQPMYTPALVKRRFSNFVETTVTSTTPILPRNLQNTSTVKRPPRHSSVTENLNSPFFKVSPRSPISNITFRRPLRNVTSAYRLSQENIMLVDSDLERLQNSPMGSGENRFSDKAEPDSIGKEKSFTKVFHSSPMIKTRRTYSKSLGKISPSPQLGRSSTQFSRGGDLELSDVERNHSLNRTSLNEGESSEDSSLVKQLTLVLSDEDLAEDEHDQPKKKRKKSSLSDSSLKSSNTASSSLLETTGSSSFTYERPSRGSNTFSDLPDITESKSKMGTPEYNLKIEQGSTTKRTSRTPKINLNNSRATTKDRDSPVTDVKRGSPKNDLTDVVGVRRPLKTFREPKQVKNDLSVVRGVRKVLATPKLERSPLNDLTQVKGLKKLMKTPKLIKSPKNDLSDVAGVRRLMESPRERKEPENDLSDVRGVRQLMSTPKEQRTPLNDITDVKGVKRLMRTPRAIKSPKNDLSNVAGVRRLMEGPREHGEPKNDLSDVRGIRRLMSTPKERRSTLNDLTDVEGVRRLMKTPRAIKSPKNDLSNVAGVRRLMEGHREQGEPKNDLSDVRGIRRLMRTPKERRSTLNDLTDVRGVKSLLRTPKSPANDLSDVYGVRDLMRSPKRRKSADLNGVKDLMMTPGLNITASSNDGASTEEMSDFDALLNKKPVRTYRGKSRSPLKSPKTGDNNVYVQPDVARWVEEQDNYLQTTNDKQTKTVEQTDLVEIKSEIESAVQSPQFRTTRRGQRVVHATKTTRSKSKCQQDTKTDAIEQPVQDSKAVRSRNKNKREAEENVPRSAESTPAKAGRSLRGKPQVKKEDSEENEAIQETRATRSRRVRKNKQQIEDDAEEVTPARTRKLLANKVQVKEESTSNDEVVEETKAKRNTRLPKNKQHLEDVAEEMTPTRTRRFLANKAQVKEESTSNDEVVEETKAKRSTRLPKNKQHIEDVAEETTPARTRRLLANKAQVKEDDDEVNEAVEKTKTTRSRRLPKIKQQIQDDSKHDAGVDQPDTELQIIESDGEDIRVDLPEVEDKLPNNKSQGARANTRSRGQNKDEVAEPDREVKATRSRRQPKTEVTQKETEVNEKSKTETRSKKQQKKNKDEEDEEHDVNEEKGPSPKSLRTRKRKADVSEDTDVSAEQALVKKTKKIVTFDADSPRRSNRTPRKLHRIADEDFEFDVDKISVGHSRKATRKPSEKTVEEDAPAPQEPRRSKRTRK